MAEPIRVLHIDDDPDFAQLTATYLEREDDRFEVTVATSSKEGRERFAEAEFDSIVCDYDLPDGNGIEILETVRKQRPDLPFILFTGKGSEEIASEAISSGVTDYLQKRSGTGQYSMLANRIQNAVSHYRIEQDLRESEGRYRRLVENSPVPIYIYSSDGTVIYANEAAVSLHGFERADEILGEHYTDLVPPDTEDEVRARFDKVLNEQETVPPSEMRTVGPDGSDRHLIVVSSPVNYEGESAVQTIAYDITERKRKEEELEWKTRAMDEAPVGILITDPKLEDNPITYANERFQDLTGYDEDEIIGRNCRFLQGRNTDPEPVAEMRRAIDNEESVTVELRNYRKDGSEFWNRVSIAPVRGDNDEVSYFVGFQQDITEWKD